MMVVFIQSFTIDSLGHTDYCGMRGVLTPLLTPSVWFVADTKHADFPHQFSSFLTPVTQPVGHQQVNSILILPRGRTDPTS